MKNRKNGIVALSLALLLALPALAILSSTVNAKETTVDNVQRLPVSAPYVWNQTWYRFDTPLVTLIFPAKGTKPMFLWWYTNDNSTIYVVKFQGLIEYLTFDLSYYNRRYNANNLTLWQMLSERYIEPKLGGVRQQLRQQIREAIMERLMFWLARFHSHYLPFSACSWNLTGPTFVSKDDVSYWAFNFTLKNVPMPSFKFAEDNIQIRCRFYVTNATEEVDQEHNYTVAAGQLKFDFVVSKWDWNIDKIKNFAEWLNLNHRNLNIEIPVNKTGLALWLNMASIKIEDLTCAENEVQNQAENQVEQKSQMQNAMIGDEYCLVDRNETNRDEKPVKATLQLRERFRERIRLHFACGERSVPVGFFEFVPWARLLDESGNTVDYVNVTASYVAAGGHLKLFVCYPYFGNYTLEHDPTVGLDYAPAIPELTTPNLLLILIGATVVIAVAVAAVKVLKKPVNVLTVK